MPAEVTGSKQEPITLDNHRIFSSGDGQTVLRVEDHDKETTVILIRKGEESVQTIEDDQEYSFDLSEEVKLTVTRVRSIA